MANLRFSQLWELQVPRGLSKYEIFDSTTLNMHLTKVWPIFLLGKRNALRRIMDLKIVLMFI